MTKIWTVMISIGLATALSTGGCTVSVNDDLDTDTGSGDADTDVDTDTGSETDTASDGEGGADEACYAGEDNGTPVFWCDGDLVAADCADNENGCCCRASCEPSVCPEVDSDEGDAYCLNIGLGDGTGVCSYEMDASKVGYACEDVCISRSQCAIFDAMTGECLDEPLPEEMGLCLYYEDAPDVDYCRQMCLLSTCDDLHICEAATVTDGTDVSYDGTGICTPII